MGLPSRLFDRDACLEQMNALAVSALDGRGHVVAIVGEAGAGKTSLARRFADGQAGIMRCLWGACEDLSIPEPLGPLHDLLAETGTTLRSMADEERDRLGLFTRCLSLFADEPTVVLIEDLHWADEATLDFVKFLSRRARDRPLLLVLTSRDETEEGRPQMRRAFGTVSRDDVTRIDLRPLSSGAIAEMARGTDADVAEVLRLSGGNAFFVTEILGGGSVSGLASVQEAVLARVDRQTAPERELLDVTSIFPRRAERSVVQRLIGSGDAEALVRACVTKGLLTDDGQYLTFRHEIARQTIERSLYPAHRRDLHARVLEAVLDRDDVATSRKLHHASAAGDTDAQARLAPLAGQEAYDSGAFLQAAEYFELALASSSAADVDSRRHLHMLAAKSHWDAGQLSRALPHAEAAQEMVTDEDDLLLRGQIMTLLSGINWELGHKATAAALGDRAIAILSDTQSEELAAALAYRGRHAMADYDETLAILLCQRAEALAHRFGRLDIHAFALATRSVCYTYDDEMPPKVAAEGIAIAEADQHHVNIARCHSNFAFALMFALRYPEALEQFDLSIAHSLEHEALLGLEFAQAGRLLLLERMGRWRTLEADLDEMFRADVQQSSAFLTIRILKARMNARRGVPVPEDALEEIMMLTRDEDMRHVGETACLLAERAWLGLEDPERALKWLDRGLAMYSQNRRAQDMLLWRHRLSPGRADGPPIGVDPAYALTMAADWSAAAEAWRAIGAPYQEALALLEGDRKASQKALSILRDLGADAVIQHALKTLEARGIAVHAPTRRLPSTEANPAGLTNRQMDVLVLLNEGLSNAEIADRLCVAPKTVDHHVSAVLTKLEVSSRGEAAALARQSGWL